MKCITDINYMTVTHFMGSGSFLLRHSKGHTKYAYSQSKKFFNYF